MNIRLATKKDYNEIETLAKEVQMMHINWNPNVYILESDIFAVDLFNIMLDSKSLYVAEDNNIIKGFVVYNVKNYDQLNQVKRTVYKIDAIAVKKEYRGQGIGTMLMNKVKSIAQENGASSLSLEVNSKNIDARKVYENYGFYDSAIIMEMKILLLAIYK